MCGDRGEAYSQAAAQGAAAASEGAACAQSTAEAAARSAQGAAETGKVKRFIDIKIYVSVYIYTHKCGINHSQMDGLLLFYPH